MNRMIISNTEGKIAATLPCDYIGPTSNIMNRDASVHWYSGSGMTMLYVGPS